MKSLTISVSTEEHYIEDVDETLSAFDDALIFMLAYTLVAQAKTDFSGVGGQEVSDRVSLYRESLREIIERIKK